MALDDYLTKKIEAVQLEEFGSFLFLFTFCQEGGVDFYKWIEAEVPYADAVSIPQCFCDHHIYFLFCDFEALLERH